MASQSNLIFSHMPGPNLHPNALKFLPEGNLYRGITMDGFLRAEHKISIPKRENEREHNRTEGGPLLPLSSPAANGGRDRPPRDMKRGSKS